MQASSFLLPRTFLRAYVTQISLTRIRDPTSHAPRTISCHAAASLTAAAIRPVKLRRTAHAKRARRGEGRREGRARGRKSRLVPRPLPSPLSMSPPPDGHVASCAYPNVTASWNATSATILFSTLDLWSYSPQLDHLTSLKPSFLGLRRPNWPSSSSTRVDWLDARLGQNAPIRMLEGSRHILIWCLELVSSRLIFY